MSGFLSKLFGGNKSEKDVKIITPYVAKINAFFEEYQSLSNDELRGTLGVGLMTPHDFSDAEKACLMEIGRAVAEKL